MAGPGPQDPHAFALLPYELVFSYEGSSYWRAEVVPTHTCHILINRLFSFWLYARLVMNTSYIAYVDEAGDDGCTPKSSEWLVLSAVVTNKATDVPTMKTVFDSTRLVLNRSEQKPFHFRRIRHHQRIPYVSLIAGAPVAAITILVNKQSVWRDRFSDRHRLYHYAIRLLVERISWFLLAGSA